VNFEYTQRHGSVRISDSEARLKSAKRLQKKETPGKRPHYGPSHHQRNASNGESEGKHFFFPPRVKEARKKHAEVSKGSGLLKDLLDTSRGRAIRQARRTARMGGPERLDQQTKVGWSHRRRGESGTRRDGVA